jgi:hypothetical protein
LLATIPAALTALILCLPSHSARPAGVPASSLVRWPPGHPDWWLVGRCEEGTLPGGGVNWWLVGTTYSGGLGFYNETWAGWARALGLAGRYPFAGLAPVGVQMLVAEYGWERGGYWGSLHNGCAR